MSRVFFAMVAVMLSLAARASAQTAVLFPVGGDAELAAAHGVEALGRVQRDLEDSSFTVLAGDELAQAMGAASAEVCGDPSCAGPMLGTLHADLAIGVALWHRNGLVQVSVVLVDPQGVMVSADADGAESVIGQATQSALSQARARWATREGSPIRVVGVPEGATITVDHELWGTVPHEGALSPGTHHFVVSADGHVTERRDVEIAAGTETVEIAFELVAGSDAVPTTPSAGPDVGWIAAGAATAGVGAAVAVVGIANLAGSERCTSGCVGAPDARLVYVPNQSVDIALTVTGAAVLVAGVVMLIVGALSGGASHSAVALTSDGFVVSY